MHSQWLAGSAGRNILVGPSTKYVLWETLGEVHCCRKWCRKLTYFLFIYVVVSLSSYELLKARCIKHTMQSVCNQLSLWSGMCTLRYRTQKTYVYRDGIDIRVIIFVHRSQGDHSVIHWTPTIFHVLNYTQEHESNNDYTADRYTKSKRRCVYHYFINNCTLL